MPQMAPISWLILFLLFSVSFILFNMMNFFCFFKSSMKNENLKVHYNKNLLNWKW